MRIHSAHEGAAGTLPVLVADALSWRVLILGWVGLLGRRSWIVALLSGAVSLTLTAAARRHGLFWPTLLVLHLALALFAPDLRRWELDLRGFRRGPRVAGPGSVALLRLLDRTSGGVA